MRVMLSEMAAIGLAVAVLTAGLTSGAYGLLWPEMDAAFVAAVHLRRPGGRCSSSLPVEQTQRRTTAA